MSWGLAVDFANTVACQACRCSDVLSDPETFTRWNRAHPELPDVSATTALRGDLISLRRDVRAILERQAAKRPPTSASVGRLNRVLRTSSTHWRAEFVERRWVLTEVPEGLSPTQEWRWRVARATVDLLAGTLGGKLLKCRAPTCDHFVVRRMRDQLWCSPACGNRVRVARHYERVRRRAAA